MKEKSWTLYKVSVYLSLSLAALVAVLLLCNFIPEYNSREVSSSAIIIYLFIFTGLVAQIVFNLLNVRLLHYYNEARLLPTTAFARWHTVFLILNSCFAVFLVIGFIGSCVDITGRFAYRHRIDKIETALLLLFGLYVFFTICTITGSIRLRRYLKHNVQQEEELWLNQLGTNASLNQ